MVSSLEIEIDELRRRLSTNPGQAEEEQRWRRMMSEERVRIEIEWKSRCEDS